MINKKFFQDLKGSYDKQEQSRKKIIGFSHTVLHDSKRVIFAIHRNDIKKARESLAEIEAILISSEKKFSHTRLMQEGSYRASVEEYVEAKILFNIIQKKKIDIFKKIKLSHETYLAGICDVTGELVRRSVNKAAEGKVREVKIAKDLINEIMEELVEFDMTGYLRTKYDQAKNSLKKIEQIAYEVKIKSS